MIKYNKDENIYREYKPGTDKILNVLPAGLYAPYLSTGGILFEKQDKDSSLINFETGIISDICNKIDKFCSEEVKIRYESMQIVHQVGVLFYGPTGTGKTSTARLIMQNIVDKYDGVGLFLSGYGPSYYSMFVEKARKLMGNENPIVILVDEIDKYHDSKELLGVLDGSMNINNVILIGCTNFLNKIPDEIKNRRSRIKYVREIDVLPDPVFKEFIKSKIPSLDEQKISEITFQASENKLVIDQLKHVLVDHFVDGVSISDAIAEVKKQFD